MNKTLTALALIVSMTLIYSCSKDKQSTTAPATVGTYTFRDITYHASHATGIQQYLSIDDYSAFTPGAAGTASLTFLFATFPTVSGTYRIVPGSGTPDSTGKMTVLFGDNNTSYNYTAANSTGRATITVDSVGKINVAITDSILLIRQGLPSDSGYLYANVKQQ